LGAVARPEIDLGEDEILGLLDQIKERTLVPLYT
jgi:hypothetical protein